MCALFALLSGPNGCVYIVQDENDRSIIFSVPLRTFNVQRADKVEIPPFR